MPRRWKNGRGRPLPSVADRLRQRLGEIGERKAQIAKEQARLDQEARIIDDALAALSSLGGPGTPPDPCPARERRANAAGDAELTIEPRRGTARRAGAAESGKMTQGEFERIAVDILRGRKEPMTRCELRREFERGGHPISGKNPNALFATRIFAAVMRHSVLVNTKSGKLWIAGELPPLNGGGYA